MTKLIKYEKFTDLVAAIVPASGIGQHKKADLVQVAKGRESALRDVVLVEGDKKRVVSTGQGYRLADEHESLGVELLPCLPIGGGAVIIIESDEEKKRLIIGLTLQKLARAYGASESIPDDVLAVLVDFVSNNFSHLGALELPFAFEQASAGRLNIDSAMYHGVFSVEYLGRILRGYEKKRKGHVAELYRLQDELEKQKSPEEIAKLNGAAQKYFIKKIVKAYEITTTGERPELLGQFYGILEKLGELGEIDPESKRRAMRKARASVMREKKRELVSKRGALARLSIVKAIEKLEAGDEVAGVIVEAQKRLVRAYFLNLARKQEPISCDDYLDRLLAANKRKK